MSNDKVVVVMGPTGAGKTTFINCAAQRDNDPGVGHDIMSQTSGIGLIPAQIDGHNVTFVDTPGFDDTYRSDVEILNEIAQFLVKSYKQQVPLDTIIYLHRITDNRLNGSHLKNLKMFVNLCGNQTMPNVIIVTTMWEIVQKETGEAREESLKKQIWFDMIEKGCIVKRFADRTYHSALEILAPHNLTHELVRVPTNHTTHQSATAAPLLSTELVDGRKKLPATAAGAALAKEYKKKLKQQQEAARVLQGLCDEAPDEESRGKLKSEIIMNTKKINKITDDHSKLKRGFLDRLFGSKPETGQVPQVGSIE